MSQLVQPAEMVDPVTNKNNDSTPTTLESQGNRDMFSFGSSKEPVEFTFPAPRFEDAHGPIPNFPQFPVATLFDCPPVRPHTFKFNELSQLTYA